MNNIHKNKIYQLYQFLKEANQLHFRPIRILSNQLKVIRLADIPKHPLIQLYRPTHTQNKNGQKIPDILLRIRRPHLTKCPIPPTSLQNWLSPNWDNLTKQVFYTTNKNIINNNGQIVTICFDNEPQRIIDYECWIEQRKAWITLETVTQKAMTFFEMFYDIYSILKKNEEELELLIADGHLFWQTTSKIDGMIVLHHPILLKRVELRFDPKIPEFTVHETEREPEIYTNLFTDLQDIESTAIRNCKIELKNAGYHPLGWDDTETFLKTFIQNIAPLKGEYLNEIPHDSATLTPRLYRDIILLLRKRNIGIVKAVDAIIDDINHRKTFPSSLTQITGTIDKWKNNWLEKFDNNANIINKPWGEKNNFNDDDILLAKEANNEQLQIIRRLEYKGTVVVQGPPGTGKTHTIGNLVGHLLTQGKSILITAQTAKALRVLRNKIPKTLQPLAITILGSDKDARRQLESSISSIIERLTNDTAASLLKKAQQLETERCKLLTQIKQYNYKLRKVLENEYCEIVIDKQTFTPSNAAQFVATKCENHSWIPSPVKLNAQINLSEQELTRLYTLGTFYNIEEEQDARYPLPELMILPTAHQFQMMVLEYQNLMMLDLASGIDYWQSSECGSQSLEKIATDLNMEFSDNLQSQLWRSYAIVAGIRGGNERVVWEKLIYDIEQTVQANTRYALIMHHQPLLSNTMPIFQQRQITKKICSYIDSGGKLGFLQLAIRSEWRRFVKSASVTSGQPYHRDHFEALNYMAELYCLRTNLEPLWNFMIGQHIQQPLSTLGATPELACYALIPEIRRCLDWHSSIWLPINERLRKEGLKFDELTASIPHEVNVTTEYLAIKRLVSIFLLPLIEKEIKRRKLRECETWFNWLINLVSQIDPIASDRGCIGRIVVAVRLHNPNAYSDTLEYIQRLHKIKPLVIERDMLIAKLKLVAPEWANQIAHRILPHHEGTIPNDIRTAWIWRQLYDILAERDKLNAYDLQCQLERTRTTLRQITEWLIDAKTWGKQLERLQNNHLIRQTLIGWLDTTKRLISTKRLDKRQLLLSKARHLMEKCINAVPVWIMPISIIAESFNAATTRFDVVIIDEASQAGLNALIALYLGKQVIIVGDHEQVTPLGIGKEQTILENLRKSILQDIPNSHLFDGLSSIYDIARQSFGDVIQLVEHFRCVPEIITFSNQLSYEGKIKPLRESNSTNIKPACVGWQVDGIRNNDINKSEACRIIDTIKAMIKHPKYANKTIGVISMLGESQALLIQSMLHKELPEVEIEKRRIQAGISSEFQGDERDIIFLSLVDSAIEESPLRTKGEGAFELIKKRYNVATSRARDQMWVIYSFNPDVHLKSGDIRLKLLKHIRNPLAVARIFDQEVNKVESPFEREVLKRLADAGYRVKSQWQVGYYRIDIVVEGAGKRLAIECDGDRYHPMEKLAEDMERQAILERLGWQFVRIRGSSFYRNPELAMRSVFDRIRELEISPEAYMNEAPESEMTLIHELDELIQSYSK